METANSKVVIVTAPEELIQAGSRAMQAVMDKAPPAKRVQLPSLIDRMNKLGDALIASIVAVWETEKEPGSDNWLIWEDQRARLVDRIATGFCEKTGMLRHRFPFSDEFVIDLWVKYRKGDKEQKQAIHEHFEVR